MEESGTKKAIKFWADDDKPREKFIAKGVEALSNSELLGILIATGTKKYSAIDIARNLLEKYQNNFDKIARLSYNELIQIEGIGPAKAITLLTAFELGKRNRPSSEKEIKILSSNDAAELFIPKLSDLNHEEFWIALLAYNNKVLKILKISEGGLSSTIVDPKKIFKAAIDNRAAAIILCHNHPTGELKASGEDIKITEKLIKGAQHLDIKVLDHIIVGKHQFISLADSGLI